MLYSKKGGEVLELCARRRDAASERVRDLDVRTPRLCNREYAMIWSRVTRVRNFLDNLYIYFLDAAQVITRGTCSLVSPENRALRVGDLQPPRHNANNITSSLPKSTRKVCLVAFRSRFSLA